MVHDVELGILTRGTLASLEAGESFLQLLDQFPTLTPDFFGDVEPVRRPYLGTLRSDVLACWNFFLWKHKNPRLQGQVLSDFKRKVHDAVFMSLSKRGLDPNLFAAFVAAFHGKWPIDFAYAVLVSDEDLLDLDAYRRTIMPFSQGLTTHALRKGLPGLPWMSVFGKPYLSLLGKDRILDVPAAIAQEIAPDLAEIRLSQSILDCERSRTDVVRTRDAVIDHLGRRFFTSADGRAEVPDFPLLAGGP